MQPDKAYPFLAELMSRDPDRVAGALRDADWGKSTDAYEALLQNAKQVYFLLPRNLPTREDGARKWAFSALLYETRDTPPSNMACGCYMSNASPHEVQSVTIIADNAGTYHVHCKECRIDYDVTQDQDEQWRWAHRL